MLIRKLEWSQWHSRPRLCSLPRIRTALILSLMLTATLARAQSADSVILDMDSVRHRPTDATNKDKQKVPVGAAQLVEGKFGKAVKFTFAADLGPGFMVSSVPANAQWDKAQGLSFWVKGDGSQSWGGLELIDRENYGLRYAYCFPIESTEWTKIIVPWVDLVPELAGPLVNPAGGYAPSKFGNVWFGKWFYWREYPAHSYTIDQIALESQITVKPLPDVQPGLARVAAKLKQKKPITIVTMGDSLTDTRHWANRQISWPQILAQRIEAKYGVKPTIVNPAMGGTTLTQNLILMPRWVKTTPSPDLVTVWFGYNDWDSGVRGDRFAEYLRLGTDRIRRQTSGSADVLLLTTCPAYGRWDTMKELEQAARDAATEKKTGLADIAAEFRKVENPDEALKQEYWAWDKTHLGRKGHETAADVVLRAIEAAQ